MFLLFDWISPVRRVTLDFMITRLFFLFPFADVFQAGLWSQRIQRMSDKLRSLVDSLLAFVLCSKAISSNAKYKNAWLNYKKWEKDNEGSN